MPRTSQALSRKHYSEPHTKAGLSTAWLSCELLKFILEKKNEQKWSRFDGRKELETSILIQIPRATGKAKEIKKSTIEAGVCLSLLSVAVTECYRLDDLERMQVQSHRSWHWHGQKAFLLHPGKAEGITWQTKCSSSSISYPSYKTVNAINAIMGPLLSARSLQA